MLTPRQREIAELVAQGLSAKAIADHTGLTILTVRTYIYQAAARLHLPGRPRHKLTIFVLTSQN